MLFTMSLMCFLLSHALSSFEGFTHSVVIRCKDAESLERYFKVTFPFEMMMI